MKRHLKSISLWLSLCLSLIISSCSTNINDIRHRLLQKDEVNSRLNEETKLFGPTLISKFSYYDKENNFVTIVFFNNKEKDKKVLRKTISNDEKTFLQINIVEDNNKNNYYEKIIYFNYFGKEKETINKKTKLEVKTKIENFREKYNL